MSIRQAVLFVMLTGLWMLPLGASVAYAQTPFSQSIVPCDGINCNVCHIATLAQRILNTAVYLAVILAAILFAWAGWVFLTAAGSTEKLGKAKSVFGNVFVGLIIILIGWIVVDTIMRTLVGSGGIAPPWNRIC